MVSFEQYPDTLTYDGKEVQCRFVPYRDTRMYRRQDGMEVIPSYKIAFPFEVEPMLIGTIISAQDESGTDIVYEQELLAFHPGQLHSLGVV